MNSLMNDFSPEQCGTADLFVSHPLYPLANPAKHLSRIPQRRSLAALLLTPWLAMAGSAHSAATTVLFEVSAPGVKRSIYDSTATTEIFGTTGNISNSSGTFTIGNYVLSGNASAYAETSPAFDLDRNVVSLQPGTLSVSLNTGPVNYLGFYWGGGDTNNYIDLYDSSDTFVATFSSADLFSTLGSGIDAYRQPSFYNEPFAYVNLTLSDSNATFSRIDFRQQVANGFEFQNVTVGLDPQPSAVPEPSGVLLTAAVVAAGAGLNRRRRIRP
jgi:hypothetical protein